MNAKKITLAISVLMLFTFSGLVSAHTESTPYVTGLIADQNLDVGDVSVWNDGENLYVKYVIDTETDWCLTETHLRVADSVDSIPQKNGNPIPGKFDYKNEHDCVTEYTYTIPLGDWDPALYIAAHAVVTQKDDTCMNVTSDTDVEWSVDGLSWNPAVACWVHPSWNDISGATWVWRTYHTDVLWEYNNVPNEGWYFKKEFTIPGEPTSGAIAINADNSYSLSLNGVYVGSEGSMDKVGPDNQEWATIDNYPLTNLNSGTNSIEVRALNFFDWGSSTGNPAGLAFNAEICYEEIETAWGAGSDFPGKNWATYFTYNVQEALVSTWLLSVNNGIYMHDMFILTQNPDGSFSGNGGYPAGSGPTYPYPYNWTLAGQLTGSVVTMTLSYQNSYIATITGTVNATWDYMSGGVGTGGVFNWSATRL